MNANRMLSLNEVASDFSIEELEPRMEMQMLGMGADPRIIVGRSTVTIIIIFTPNGTIVI
jgi:hypothetical protein